MRQVFTSARIENVEAVAGLLREHGIEVRISNGRGWRGAIRGNFSYRHDAPTREQPAVWVIRADDQPQARRLLREAGLIADTRNVRESYLAQTVHGGDDRRRRGLGGNLRVMLLVAVVLGVGLIWFNSRPRPETQAATTGASIPAAGRPAASAAPPVDYGIAAPPAPYPAAMPTALARLLVDEARAGAAACVRIDGADPAPEWLAQWTDGSVSAASACDAGEMPGALRIDVGDYRTDGMGEGSARVSREADGTTRSRHLRVRREGLDWQVLGPARE